MGIATEMLWRCRDVDFVLLAMSQTALHSMVLWEEADGWPQKASCTQVLYLCMNRAE